MNFDQDALEYAQAAQLVSAVAEATATARNEAAMRHGIEVALERACAELGIAWTPLQLERVLRNSAGNVGFADVVHGAVIIEYEPPRSFGAGRHEANVVHAQHQADEYARRMGREEGRNSAEYVLLAWDGAHVTFGAPTGSRTEWQRIEPFGHAAALRILRALRDQGRPLVHPAILKVLVGPESAVGNRLIPALFRAICAAQTARANNNRQTRTALLFTEWCRLFGQAIGVETERLDEYLNAQARAHDADYRSNIAAYLFALHTHIAIVAKLVAALSLPAAAQDIADPNTPLRLRLSALESGRLFVDAGIENMLSGDFFSWYIDSNDWPPLEGPLSSLVERLRGISFDLARKRPDAVRDLFKGMYEEFVPRELRHALGEVYTPDWLAAHAIDQLGWQPEDDLLDPTCGSGTFLLEAVRRRLVALTQSGGQIDVERVLDGIHGMDLNPLAVLAAKASLVVVFAAHLRPNRQIILPIYLADAINSATVNGDGYFSHTIQTELGPKVFVVPEQLVRSRKLHAVFEQIRGLICADLRAVSIVPVLNPALSDLGIRGSALAKFAETIDALADLHDQNWDGIWCPILAERFAAGAIGRVSHIAGNPPWVKWSHLPPAYAEFIKPICSALNVFSTARYVGGIEADISTVITFVAIRRWLAARGKLAFYITGTVFSNESSQGFRRMANQDGSPMAAILAVENFKAISPFVGVTNDPALLLLQEGAATDYPIEYTVWSGAPGAPTANEIQTSADFRTSAEATVLLAQPVPGTDSGPWLKGTRAQHAVWETLFDAALPSHYRARKGVTTDLNGVYFVRLAADEGDTIWAQNDPAFGRKGDLPQVRKRIEKTHVFPLMRGRGLRPFCANLDTAHVIIPQRGMNGDPTLPMSAPLTYSFLIQFETWLRVRGSYRRYQSAQPVWSTWSTGAYTFSPYKVLWKEMSGGRFCAAYVGPVHDPLVGDRVVVPDHKLYFVPVESLQEAQYLTAILNAPVIAGAISAYAAQLSLGTSVVENLKLPRFAGTIEAHIQLAQLAETITQRGGTATAAEYNRLNSLAVEIVAGHT